LINDVGATFLSVHDLLLDFMPFVSSMLDDAPRVRNARLVAIHVNRVVVGIKKLALIKEATFFPDQYILQFRFMLAIRSMLATF
jgi:hypothetical protein